MEQWKNYRCMPLEIKKNNICGFIYLCDYCKNGFINGTIEIKRGKKDEK